MRTRALRIDAATADETFLALRDAARRNDAQRAQELAAQLQGFDVPSYVDYFRIKARSFDTGGGARIDAPDTEITAFLQRHRGEAIADRMRNDWLLVLGKRRDWTTFDTEYPQFALDDDTQVKCYALMSRAQRGVNVGDEARSLLSDPRHYGEACPELISMLAQNGQFSSGDVRRLVRWALEVNLVTMARRIAAALPGERANEDAVAAITRQARADPAAASARFALMAPGLSKADQAAGWGVIGQFLAKRLSQDAMTAYQRQSEAGHHDTLSPESHEWKVRTALRNGDWRMVRQAVESMPPEQRQRDPAWAYWHARALKAEGRDSEARSRFAVLAGQFNFYGKLAQEELGQRIAIPPRTVVSAAEVDAVRQRPGFARAQRFYALNMRFEGNREWNWELRGMSDRQLLAAAEYARRIELFDRVVSTADRTRNEHDFSLRFPMPFREQMTAVTQQIGVDMSWVYGLVRQESRFIMNARSSVGASGLMQVMPATGRWVANKIGIEGFHPSQLNERDTNLLIGNHYLNMVLGDLDGSWLLASAAYNAGPGRPKNWRATLTRPVEGAIFAETIPFSETRNYVKHVLSNAVYYSILTNGQPQSLKSHLGTIAPRQAARSDLP